MATQKVQVRRVYEPERFDEFTRRCTSELAEPGRACAVDQLRHMAAERTLTMLTATRRPEISEAAVLSDVLRSGESSRAHG